MTTYPARPSQFTPLTTAFEWEKLFAVSGVWDGVDGTDLQPSLVSGPNVRVQPGTAIIKGQLWRTDAYVDTAVPANASGSPRIDKLALQYDRQASADVSVVSLVVVTGTPATSPQPPLLRQDQAGQIGGSGVWQIPIAQWTTAANGTVSGMIDIRQYAGHSVVAMTSTTRPNPYHPRLGLETDTGYLLRWDGATWRNIGPKNQVELANGTTGSTTAWGNMFTPFPLGANDVNASASPVAYRIRCSGYGVQSSSAPKQINFSLVGYGHRWGGYGDTGNISVSSHFNWDLDCELILASNGSFAFTGKCNVCHDVPNPGPSQSTMVYNQTGVAGAVNVVPATSLVVQAIWGGGSGSGQSLTCTGATFERVAN